MDTSGSVSLPSFHVTFLRMAPLPIPAPTLPAEPLPCTLTRASPETVMSLTLLTVGLFGFISVVPLPMPAAYCPPCAVTSPPEIVMLLGLPTYFVLSAVSKPPPMPAPPLPPVAFREPLLSSSLMVRLPSLPFSTPARPKPLLTVFSPSSSMLTLPAPPVDTAAAPMLLWFVPVLLTSMFTPESVTLAVAPASALTVTVLLAELPVMTGAASGTSTCAPCVTVCSVLVAFTVMSPLATSHSAANAETGRPAMNTSAMSADIILFFFISHFSFFCISFFIIGASVRV